MTAIDYDWEYNNRRRVPNAGAIIEGWKTASAQARTDHRPARLDLAYGPAATHRLDLYEPEGGGRDRPLILFIHGGYWQMLDKADFAFVAPPFTRLGARVAVVNHTLCPAIAMAGLVEEIRQAAAWLYREFKTPLDVMGHSAGGHLTAMLAAVDWRAWAGDLPADLVRSGLSVSGLFDLEPLRHMYVNDALGLDAAEAKRQSPVFLTPKRVPPLVLAVGGLEGGEFHRQSDDLAKAWQGRGSAIEVLDLPGRDHFTALDALIEPGHVLHQTARRLIGV